MATAEVMERPATSTITLTEMETNPEKWERFELYRGTPVEMTFTKPIYARILSNLTYLMVDWICNKSGIGEVYGGEGGIRLSDNIWYCYDLAWNQEPLPDNEIPTKSLDLMIEIISDGNDMERMMQKVDDYFQYGAKQVCLVYPARKCVEVRLSNNTAKTYTMGDTIAMGDLMPGLELAVKDVFV